MTQGLVEIPRIHLWLQTIVSQTHWFLCQQSYLNSQVYKAFRKLIERDQSYSKATTLQMLHTPNSTLWISAMILQQGSTIIPYENSQQNAEKSCHLDPGGLQNFALCRNWSHCWNYPYKVLSAKNHQKIANLTLQTPEQSYHKKPYGWLTPITHHIKPVQDRFTNQLTKNSDQRSPHWLIQQVSWDLPIIFSY